MSNVHGTAILLGGRGLLLRGPSGAGKSLLALDLLEQALLRGEAALLVSDDRVELVSGPDGVRMVPPPAIAGLIELRGRGILSWPHAAGAPLHLVVDLVDALERFLEDEELETLLAGHMLPRCPVPRRGVADGLHQRLLVHAALRALG